MLTQEQREDFTKHAREFLKACPICANEQWELLNEIIGPFTWTPEPKVPFPGMIAGPSSGPGLVPFVCAICTRCFFAAHFPWLVIEAGLAKRRQEKHEG